MAFMIKKLNDPGGILFLMLLALPLRATANFDCNGKPFHCVNSTHFMICVDLGRGVSSTMDDFVIPCPPPTVCQSNNRFECEFPTVSTQAPQALETITVQPSSIDQITEVKPSEPVTINFEELYNTLSTTTLSYNEISPLIPIVTTDSSVTDVFDSLNNATFGNHANLKTDGSNATQVLTTETQVTQTELFKTSTSLPENFTLQKSATAIDSTTAVTEASTNLDTITTPFNDINTTTLKLSTNIPHSTSITGESSQTTLTGAQLNTSQSALPNDQKKTYNTTHDIQSTTSSYVSVTSNEAVTTETTQSGTDVVNNVNFTQTYEIKETTVQSPVITTDFKTSVIVTESTIYLPTKTPLPPTENSNHSLTEMPVIETSATTRAPTTVGFENVVDLQNNITEPFTEQITEPNQEEVSTLSSLTDLISVTDTIFTTDSISLLPSPIPTTESNISMENNSSTVNANDIASTVVTNTVDLTSISTPLAEIITSGIPAELNTNTTEPILTTNDVITSTGHTTVTRSNTIYDTRATSISSVEPMESTTTNYEMITTITNRISFESTSQFTTHYNNTENLAPYLDTKNETQTTESVVIDITTDNIHNNKSSYQELKNEIQNETLLVANVNVTENVSPTGFFLNTEPFNFTTQPLGVTTEPRQHTPLAEVYSTTNPPETTSENIAVQTLVMEDGNNKVLQSTESFITNNINITDITQQPESNVKIAQLSENKLLTTMSLQNTAEEPLELTTATNNVRRETVNELSMIISQITSTPSNSNLNAPDVDNSSVLSDSKSQNTSNLTISNANISKTTIPIPILTVATLSENSKKPTESLLSTAPSFISTKVDEKQFTMSSPQFQEILTTVVPVPSNQDKTNIEKDKDDVQVNIVKNKITTPVFVKSVDDNLYSTNQASNVTQNATTKVMNVLEQDKRNVPSKENKSIRLDSVSPMTNLQKLSQITEPDQIPTVASTKIAFTEISDDPFSVNVLEDKYQNSPHIPTATTDSSVTDVFESLNNATFGSHANLETDGSSATQVLTTETQVTQTESLKTSTSLPENFTLQTSATAIDSTSAVTEASTNLDTSQPALSTKIAFTEISDDTLSVNVLDDKYQNSQTKHDFRSTKMQRVVPTQPSITDGRITEGKVKDMSSKVFSEQIPKQIPSVNNPAFGQPGNNAATLTSKLNNSDKRDILNNSSTSINADYTETSTNKIKVVINSNNPAIIKPSVAESLPLKHQGEILETFTKDNTTMSEVNPIRIPTKQIVDVEQSDNSPLSTTININVNNESIFDKHNENKSSNIKSNGTEQISSKVVDPPGTTPTFRTTDSKLFVEPPKVNGTTPTPVSQQINLSTNNDNILTVVKITTLPSKKSEKVTINTLNTSKTPKNAVLENNTESANTITVVSHFNSPTEVPHSSVASISSYNNDNILKTNTKYNIFEDEEYLKKEPTDKVSEMKKDNEVEGEKLNKEQINKNVKLNDNKIPNHTPTFPRTSKIDEAAGMTEVTKGYINNLSSHPNLLDDNGKNTVDKLNPNTAGTKSEPIEVAESNIKKIPQLPKEVQTVIGTKVTPKNINTVSPRPTTTTARAVESQFLCKPYLRGRFADNHDCRKFYICIGRPYPMVGMCPINTVFSEIRKQCTKNLSHCVRNNQFQCVSEGRFSDFLNDNFYYICVRNKLNHFIRFKLRCQNGYHINKTSVRCVLNTEISQSISVSSDKSISDQSKPLERLQKMPVSGGFECEKEGKFADPNDCRTYYVCKLSSDSEFGRKKKKCDSDEYFHNDKKKCVDAESYECKS